MNLSVWCQVFMEAVLAVVVFGIKIGFNDKGTHPQDKHSCSWRSRGFREPPHSVQGGAWSTDTWVWEEFSCLVTHCFFSVFFFLQQHYGSELGFRFGLSVDPILYHLAPQILSLKTQSKIEFLGLFSVCRKVVV